MKKKIFMILLLLLSYCTLIAQNTIVVRKKDNLNRGKSCSNVRASNKANSLLSRLEIIGPEKARI